MHTFQQDATKACAAQRPQSGHLLQWSQSKCKCSYSHSRHMHILFHVLLSQIHGKDAPEQGLPWEDGDAYLWTGLPQLCMVNIPRVIRYVHTQSCPVWLTHHFVTALHWKHRVRPWTPPHNVLSERHQSALPWMHMQVTIPFEDDLFRSLLWNPSFTVYFGYFSDMSCNSLSKFSKITGFSNQTFIVYIEQNSVN